MSEKTTADICQKCKKPICLTERTIGGYPLVPGVWCECGAVHKDVCPRCGGSGVPIASDGNRFHCINGHVWGLEVEQPGDDPVNAPAHYRHGPIETIAAIEAALTPEEFRGHLKACVMKYLWRANHKGDTLGDVRKAQTYLDWLVERTK